MRNVLIGIGFVSLLVSAGCTSATSRTPQLQLLNDMRFQGKLRTQGETAVFSDHRVNRPPVVGTVAIGHLNEDEGFFKGVVNKQYVGRNPVKVDAELLHWGQRRFNTYCSPCHDQTGQGRGVVGQRAIWIPTNLMEDRVRQFNDGEIFDVITNGRRSMPSYRFQIPARDRWAIISYVRALQRATGGSIDEVPADLRSGLKVDEAAMKRMQAAPPPAADGTGTSGAAAGPK